MKPLAPEVERRRRLLTRTLPLTIVAVVAFILGAAAGTPGSTQTTAAKQFTQAWARHKFAAMYEALNPASKRMITASKFIAAYRGAETIATQRSLLPGSPSGSTSTGSTLTVSVPMTVKTIAFGRVMRSLKLPLAEGGVAWNPSLVFPGLRRGEHLQSQIELAPRASILANDGAPLATGAAAARSHPLGSAALDVTGEVGAAETAELPALARRGFAADTPVGVSGLEKAFNTRLAGRPGGSLLAVAGSGGSTRTLAHSEPGPGAAVKTTIDPHLQAAAVTALGARTGESPF